MSLPLSFADWMVELRRLADERDIGWVICADGAAHRQSFDAGLDPQEEITRLGDLCEWRGCGCGGG